MNEIIAIVEYDNNTTVSNATVNYTSTVNVSSVGIQGPSGASTNLEDLLNVDKTNLENGSVLVYSTASSKWITTRNLEEQYMNAGYF